MESKTKTQTPELYRNFIKATCTRGSECKYSHGSPPTNKPPTPPANPPKDKKPWAEGKGGAPTVAPSYTVMSKNQRAIAGVPRGVISALNPVGYDEKQILTVKKLQINDEFSQMCKAEKEAEDDAWASQDPSRFANGNAVSGYKIHKFAGEGTTDAGTDDPVKGADVPDEVTETRDEDDNTSISEADIRDQFRNDIQYPISPFGSPQVDVVTDPNPNPTFFNCIMSSLCDSYPVSSGFRI
jgi:hypothetical protein